MRELNLYLDSFVPCPLYAGSTVDYEEELIRSGFRILDNPQADKKCSCGSSFTPKIEL